MQVILIVSTSKIPIPPKKGGAIEKLLFDIYQNLKEKFNIKIVASEKTGNYNYLILNALKISYTSFSLLYEFYWGLKLTFLFWKTKPSIVHLNTPLNSLFPVLFRFLYSQTRFVYTSHNPSWTVPETELSFFNRLIEKIERFVMKRCDVIVAISKAMRNGFIKKAQVSERKIRMINNFVDTKKFSPKYGKEWKRKNKINGPIVLYVGKLTETKGIPYLIKAIPSVIKEIPDVNFIFVGGKTYGVNENPYIILVKKLKIEKNVYFLGSVDEKMLPKIYSSADIFVLPSLREGFPLVILEALSSGLPIIATSTSGVLEIIDKNVGILIPKKSSKHIARAILKLLKNKKLRKKMAKCARKKALKFDKNKLVKEYEKVYRELLKVSY